MSPVRPVVDPHAQAEPERPPARLAASAQSLQGSETMILMARRGLAESGQCSVTPVSS